MIEKANEKKQKASTAKLAFSATNDEDKSSCQSSNDEFEDIWKEIDQDFEIPTIHEKQLFLRRMSKKLVEEKIKKINILVSIYQYVQKNWIEQIFFKNEKDEVEELLQ